jgi:hypothetical protein
MPRLGQSRRECWPGRGFWRKADKIAGDLNVLLVVIVVGLATLDFTFLLTQKIVERLPPMTRMVHEEAPVAPELPAARPQP